MTHDPREPLNLFPSNRVSTWNGGTWPPQAYRKRWRELFDAAITARTEPLHVPPVVREGEVDELLRSHAVGIVHTAAAIADEALRLEVERGMGP